MVICSYFLQKKATSNLPLFFKIQQLLKYVSIEKKNVVGFYIYVTSSFKANTIIYNVFIFLSKNSWASIIALSSALQWQGKMTAQVTSMFCLSLFWEGEV